MNNKHKIPQAATGHGLLKFYEDVHAFAQRAADHQLPREVDEGIRWMLETLGEIVYGQTAKFAVGDGPTPRDHVMGPEEVIESPRCVAEKEAQANAPRR